MWQLLLLFLGLFQSASCYVCAERSYDDQCLVANVSEPYVGTMFPSNETVIWILNSTIPVFNRTLFMALATVEKLTVHRLQIEELTLDGCNSLGNLFASYNAIERFDTVEGLPLRQLHLYQNRLTDVSAVRKLTHVEQLYLHENLLESVRLDTFVPLKHLKILTLHRNRLRTVSTGSLGRPLVMPRLEQLFLQHNHLPHLDTSLWRMERLRVLDVSHNQLGYLLTFLEELASLRTIGLHNNPWHCGWLFGMLERLEMRQLTEGECAADGCFPVVSDDEASCPGLRLQDRFCCSENATAPDPVLLLVSRTGIVDELHQQMRGTKRRIETLEESQRKQARQFAELVRKFTTLEELCTETTTEHT